VYTGDVLRRVFTLGSAVSLVLCLATALLWVKSYWRADDLSTDRLASAAAERWEDQRFELWTSPDVLSLRISRLTVTDPQYAARMLELGENARPFRGYRSSIAHLPAWRDPPQTAGQRLGFYFNRADGSIAPYFAQQETTIAVPLWLIVVLLSVLPVTWLVRLRGRYTRRGLCATCGYDLRASIDRCPECDATLVRAAPVNPPGV
jgi:hypothetical protein